MGVKPPRIRDPQRYPVVGIDDHLPPLPADALTPAALRQRFADSQRPWTPEFLGDARLFALEREPVAASVLVPLVERDDGLHVLLTRRTDHLTDHAGQVGFPGGRAEPDDIDAVDTALREAARRGRAWHASACEVLGPLPTYTTVSSYVVTPVVALVQPPFQLALDAFEVAEAFEVPLQFLMTPAHHHRHAVEFEGVRAPVSSMPWQGVDAQGQPREYFIWGATAAMLRNLYRFLR